jgi:hypothetical protein
MIVNGDRNTLFQACITTALERFSDSLNLVAYNSKELRNSNSVNGVALELLLDQTGGIALPEVSTMKPILGFYPDTLIVTGVSLPMADAMSRHDVCIEYDCFKPYVVAKSYESAIVKFDITI